MFLSYFVPIFLCQVVFSNALRCEEDTITTTPVNDLQDVLGKWYDVYVMYNIFNHSKRVAKTNCYAVEISVPTTEDIEEYKEKCGSYQNAQTNNIIAKVSMEGYEDRFTAKDNTTYYLLENCYYNVEFVVRTVSENYQVMIVPEYQAAELFAKEVTSTEEAACVARNIDVLKGWSGFPLC